MKSFKNDINNSLYKVVINHTKLTKKQQQCFAVSFTRMRCGNDVYLHMSFFLTPTSSQANGSMLIRRFVRLYVELIHKL